MRKIGAAVALAAALVVASASASQAIPLRAEGTGPHAAGQGGPYVVSAPDAGIQGGPLESW